MESQNPDVQWALDLLAPDPLYERNFLSKHMIEISSVILGSASVCYSNYLRGLPYIARPHLYVGVTGGLLLVSYLVDDHYRRKWARRDAVLRDYVIRHPEDFPPPERKKYGEIFDTFVPTR